MLVVEQVPLRERLACTEMISSWGSTQECAKATENHALPAGSSVRRKESETHRRARYRDSPVSGVSFPYGTDFLVGQHAGFPAAYPSHRREGVQRSRKESEINRRALPSRE